LRERISTNIDAIMRDAIEVKVNMMASGNIKHRFDRGDKKSQGDAQPSISQYSEDKFDLMLMTMEKLMERMSMGKRPAA
jgi:aromatic ring-opening dioxygenase catalytic subunit (LigB family)